MSWTQTFKQRLEQFVQTGAAWSSTACVGLALASAVAPGSGTAIAVAPLLNFLVSVGGNLVASILDWAAQGKQISEEELFRTGERK
jgi:hypothetical protein